MKWCEHSFEVLGEMRFYREIRVGIAKQTGSVVVGNNWHFCPICGTPRPKEKSLAEKMKESVYATVACGWDDYQKLEKIAEQHFLDLGWRKP